VKGLILLVLVEAGIFVAWLVTVGAELKDAGIRGF
jgi:hypothetical protein